jgi:hypothetical protein
LIGLTLLTRAIIISIQKGWVLWIFQNIKHYLSKTWISVALGVEKLRNNWIGRVLILLGMCNLLLLLPWAFWNVDFLAFVRSTYFLLHGCVNALFEPAELLKAFDTWKDTVPILGVALLKGTKYVDYVLDQCYLGNMNVLVIIPLTSVAIVGVALALYALWNIDKIWKMVPIQDTWNYILTPQPQRKIRHY